MTEQHSGRKPPSPALAGERRRKTTASVAGGRKSAPGTRTCALTRTAAPKATLVRLALGPERTPYVDLVGRAPGRGFYVVAERARLVEALTEKGAGRVFKGKARPLVPDEAMRHVEDAVRRLDERLLELLGLARRAGVLELGMDAVCRMLNSAAVVVIAADASDRTRHRVESNAERADVPCSVIAHDKATLGARLGRETLSVVAIRPSSLAERWATEVVRSTGLRGSGGLEGSEVN